MKIHPPLSCLTPPFYPPRYLHIYRICADNLLKSMARLCICHGINEVTLSINLFDIHDLLSLVGLPKAHYVNYSRFFLNST